jgi:hypothetical protein
MLMIRTSGNTIALPPEEVIEMRAALNTLVAAVGVSLAVATCSDSPTTPSPVCTITVSPTTADFGSNGGTGSVTVGAPAGCAWSATAGASWITVTGGAAGSGPGTVTYTLAANTGVDVRSAPLTVGGQTLTVRQQGRTAASCTYTLSHERQAFGSGSGSGSFTVSSAAECTWSATPDSSWVTITGGAQGIGSGTVEYSVASNSGISGRDARITVADRTFEVQQAGDVTRCEYSIGPVEFSPCMPAGSLQVTLTTQASCPWTATPNASWITLPGADSGSGSAVITMIHGDNYAAPREGIVEVRWPAPTAGQNLRIAQAGCSYGVTPAAFTFGAGAGSGSFVVVQQSIPTACGGATQDRCIWTATSTVPWITITTTMPRTGDDPVSFTVQANTSSQARTGQLTVMDKTITVAQGGQ